VGGSGDDRLNGGLGKDLLTGNAGKDTFIFRRKLSIKNVDIVRDFSHADDQFQLSSKISSKIERGTLKKSAFVVGIKALAADDRSLFNAKTGAVSYDVMAPARTSRRSSSLKSKQEHRSEPVTFSSSEEQPMMAGSAMSPFHGAASR
jgi:hypothetical protein